VNASTNDSSSFFLVYFNNKHSGRFDLSHPEEFLSIKSIERRKKYKIKIDTLDLPVNQNYIDQLKNISGIKVIGISKWLNAIELTVDKGEKQSTSDISNIIQKVQSLEFVKEVKYIGTLENKTETKDSYEIDSSYYIKSGKLLALKRDSSICMFRDEDYGKSFDQNKFLGIPELNRLSGKMNSFEIAVFDAGFRHAYKLSGMEDLLDSKQIVRDYVDHDNNVWEDDQHGCNVLGFLKTYDPGNYIGSAPFAHYTLIRTENADLESLTEEVNWLLAAEFVDSLGVDLISASLGYHAFDENQLSHRYEESTGDSSIVSRAANIAYKKGIMVVVSAGNEGNHSWRHIGFPADALNAITIGACDDKGYHAKFSSVGPTVDGRIKPDFLAPGYKVNVAAAYGFYPGNGTSYSTPIFSGALANLMYLNKNTTMDSIKLALLNSSTHRHMPDSLYGNGIPDFALAANFLSGFDTTSKDVFWINKHATIFQDLNIYYYSSYKQNIKITVSTKIKSKTKTIHKETYLLEKGQIFESDILLQYLFEKKKLKKKKWLLSNLELTFETESGTFQKSFQIK
jgi:hypothetical protein